MWIERKARLQAPVSEVFAYIADFRTLEEYNPSIREVRCLTQGPPGQGSEYDLLLGMFGRTLRSRLIVTDFQKDKLITTRVESFIPARENRMFQSAGTNTLFHFTVEFACGWPVVGPLVDRILARSFAERQADVELRMLVARFAGRREEESAASL